MFHFQQVFPDMCLDQIQFIMPSSDETFNFPPNNITKDLIKGYMLKINELNFLLSPKCGPSCKHDAKQMKNILIDIGRMYHLLVPLKVRPSAHQRMAHTLEYILYHGSNVASERICEHLHQPLKRASEETRHTCREDRVAQLLIVTMEKIKKESYIPIFSIKNITKLLKEDLHKKRMPGIAHLPMVYMKKKNYVFVLIFLNSSKVFLEKY